VGPIVASFTGTATTGTTLTVGGFLTVVDQITGKVYSAVWREKKQQQELSGTPPSPLKSSVSTASIAGL
jgi:hypothetical protein